MRSLAQFGPGVFSASKQDLFDYLLDLYACHAKVCNQQQAVLYSLHDEMAV